MVNYWSAETKEGTNSAVWTTWTTADCGTSATTNHVWTTWCDSGTTCAVSDTSTSNFYVWVKWVSPDSYQASSMGTEIVRHQTPEEIQKQKEENDRRLAEIQAEAKRREETRKMAREKALQLLLDNLEENQAEIFKATGAIPIVSPSGRKYKILTGITRNVEELDETGKKVKNLCFHPGGGVPDYDAMLVQKFMLEHCEEEARKIANFS